jgi:hypothetical protein
VVRADNVCRNLAQNGLQADVAPFEGQVNCFVEDLDRGQYACLAHAVQRSRHLPAITCGRKAASKLLQFEYQHTAPPGKLVHMQLLKHSC